MSDTTTKADADAAFDAFEKQYEKANASSQSAMRLMASLGVIFHQKGISNEDKAKALELSVRSYACDVIMNTCEKLAEGHKTGMGIELGLAVFVLAASKRGEDATKALLTMIEDWPDNAQPAA